MKILEKVVVDELPSDCGNCELIGLALGQWYCILTNKKIKSQNSVAKHCLLIDKEEYEELKEKIAKDYIKQQEKTEKAIKKYYKGQTAAQLTT